MSPYIHKLSELPMLLQASDKSAAWGESNSREEGFLCRAENLEWSGINENHPQCFLNLIWKQTATKFISSSKLL